MHLFTKQRVTDVFKQSYSYHEGKGRGINWETGTDIYTLLYIKCITNKNLLHTQGTLFSTL